MAFLGYRDTVVLGYVDMVVLDYGDTVLSTILEILDFFGLVEDKSVYELSKDIKDIIILLK